MAPAQQFDRNGQIIATDRGRPPEAVAYLNPFLAQVDVLCGTEATFGGWCSIESSLLQTQQGPVFEGGPVPAPMPAMPLIDPTVKGGGVVAAPDVAFAPADVQPFGVTRDAFWPKSVIAWLVLSLVMLLLTVQFVSPTRRWRLRRGRRSSVDPA
jgi:hypothetical protein